MTRSTEHFRVYLLISTGPSFLSQYTATIQYSSAVLYCTVQLYCTIQYNTYTSTVLYCTVQLYCAVQFNCIVLMYNTVQLIHEVRGVQLLLVAQTMLRLRQPHTNDTQPVTI